MRDAGIQQIVEVLPEHFMRLMRNWVRAKSGGMGFAISGAYSGIAPDTFDGPSMPILLGEAADVDRALERVPLRERAAVMVFWQFEGRSLPWFGRRLGLDYRTAQTRIMAGHNLVQRELRTLAEATARLAEANRQAALDSGAFVGLSSRM